MIPLSEPEWLLERQTYLSEEDGFYESLFCLTNGALGVRATSDFKFGQGSPGCFYYNLYGNRQVNGQELINGINLAFWTAQLNDRPFSLAMDKISSFRQVLDMKQALVEWQFTVTEAGSDVLEFRMQWLLPAGRMDTLLISYQVTPLVPGLRFRLSSGLDWSHGNGYMGGANTAVRLHHLEEIDSSLASEVPYVLMKNRSAEQYLAVAFKHLHNGAEDLFPIYEKGGIAEGLVINEPITLHKVVVHAVGENGSEELSTVASTVKAWDEKRVRQEINDHVSCWAERWSHALEIKASAPEVEGVRYANFQMLQCPHREAGFYNIPARGLTSEYHSGHLFFNSEFYHIPYYCYFEPDLARKMLHHRIATLEQAKQFASDSGFEGARYPEEADFSGNPSATHVIKDVFNKSEHYEWSGIEVYHLSADVLYAIDNYLQLTGDETLIDHDFVNFLTNIARYAASALKFDETVGGYGLKGVMCFDEFHYHVDHHYATNYLLSWVLHWACEFFEKRSLSGSEVDTDILVRWKQIAKEVYLPSERKGIIPQFKGYFDLVDQKVLRRTVNMLPEIDKASQEKLDSLEPFQTQIIKQADVVFLLSLFPEEFDLERIEKCFDFYEERTLHASSLSVNPHASIASLLGRTALSRDYLLTALRYNIDFLPKKHYKNGIHIAAYAGGLVNIVKDLCGVRMSDRSISLCPCLPEGWREVAFSLMCKNSRIRLSIDNRKISVEKISGEEVVTLKCGDKTVELKSVGTKEYLSYEN